MSSAGTLPASLADVLPALLCFAAARAVVAILGTADLRMLLALTRTPGLPVWLGARRGTHATLR
jgi:hypothetical protein